MDSIKGLKEYVQSEEYRSALGLPKEQQETYQLLAQGEYNRNYYFVHPVTGRELLLRVNCGSQMHLENQIEYEARALKLLWNSGRTPELFYVDGSKQKLEQGALVMEYLPGHVLDYRMERKLAAECLADIHSVQSEDMEKYLISPEGSLEAILTECEDMFRIYEESLLGESHKKKKIRTLLERGWEKARRTELSCCYRCCINTELNSTNFLINGKGKKNYIIDWEKPLYGDPAQDLGHFLAPTTTFWKTDVILNQQEMDEFVEDYIASVNGRFPTEGLKERVDVFIPITCLRGITWCAMAWVQYQAPDKLIFNESTFRKLEQYLEERFLDKIGAYLD
ncbi:MAG: aminoglycoside phosphotransferase family protein [Lachnospiraceae bacterium]|nr:aminoglycoside phosphotransferase family protein [Lachnospiraceae bacterium]